MSSIKLSSAVTQLVALWLFAAIAAGPLQAIAAGPLPVTDLGKPFNIVSTQSYYPLAGYRHEGKLLRRGARVEALFLGDQVGDESAEVEWPFVKALGQFGTFLGAAVLEGQCGEGKGGRLPTFCGVAGFDLDHARYASRYVSLVYRDLEDRSGNCHARLPAAEMALLRRNHIDFYTHPYNPCGYLYNSVTEVSPPLIAVGGYVETAPNQIPTLGDFDRAIPPVTPGGESSSTGLPFADIQNALIAQKDPPNSYLVEHVNAEANIITTLICHADGMKPRSVCDRSVIKRIMKNVK